MGSNRGFVASLTAAIATYVVGQGPFWPYYTGFSVEETSVKRSSRGLQAYLTAMYVVGQNLFWPYYTRFSVRGRSIKRSNPGLVASFDRHYVVCCAVCARKSRRLRRFHFDFEL